jgi:hypothetical protein
MTPEQKVHATAIVSSDLWKAHIEPFAIEWRRETLEELADQYKSESETQYLRGFAAAQSQWIALPRHLKATERIELSEDEEDNLVELHNRRLRQPEPPTGRRIVDIHGTRVPV